MAIRTALGMASAIIADDLFTKVIAQHASDVPDNDLPLLRHTAAVLTGWLQEAIVLSHPDNTYAGAVQAMAFLFLVNYRAQLGRAKKFVLWRIAFMLNT